MGNDMPVPAEYYAGFARWHRLSLMRSPRTLREINEVARTAAEPAKLRQLIRLIEEELGYPLYQTVSAVKAELSRKPTGPRCASITPAIAIEAVIERERVRSLDRARSGCSSRRRWTGRC